MTQLSETSQRARQLYQEVQILYLNGPVPTKISLLDSLRKKYSISLLDADRIIDEMKKRNPSGLISMGFDKGFW